ncbi:low temperature requirement protein A [Streptomyces sp. N2-109]|uniref:Low temperature requirement protein A n=1 Tax=Streptomyces gossypii TaxID=2883101 RepID=A0ABT2JW20_9ACTN|nr:low temperature requirement protein A [Streptomyces gossypii]MCT2592070.1 low temperature requirement protein A [Streptomyces gossypii]
MNQTGGRMRLETQYEGGAVTPLELYFDLVFVFALTGVTAFMAEDLSWHGMLRGALIFGLLWWSWVCYAWVGNVVRADEGVARLAMLTGMTVMFVLALSIPEAFEDGPGGLHGPVVMAVCYFLFRAVHIVLFWFIAAGDRGLRGQLLRLLPSMLSATTLLLFAAGTHGTVQTVLWAAALVADYLGNYLGGARGWRIRSARHFAERHGLILIIALGESIVAISVGMAERPISWPIVVAAVLGLTLASSLWWSYFDVTSLLAEQAFSSTPVAERPRLARDAYSYLHLPLIGGVVLLALGLKKVLEYVGDTEHHDLADPLKGIGLFALTVGVVLYLLAHVVFKWRVLHVLNVERGVLAVALLSMLLIGPHIPALASLGVLAAAMAGLVVFETARFAEARERIRHAH